METPRHRMIAGPTSRGKAPAMAAGIPSRRPPIPSRDWYQSGIRVIPGLKCNLVRPHPRVDPISDGSDGPDGYPAVTALQRISLTLYRAGRNHVLLIFFLNLLKMGCKRQPPKRLNRWAIIRRATTRREEPARCRMSHLSGLRVKAGSGASILRGQPCEAILEPDISTNNHPDRPSGPSSKREIGRVFLSMRFRRDRAFPILGRSKV